MKRKIHQNQGLCQWRRGLLITFVAIVATINGIAYLQAYSMTHFVEAGEHTKKPEKLSLSEKLKVVLVGRQLPRPINSRTPRDETLTYETHSISLSNEEHLEAWFLLSAARGIVILFPGYGFSKDALLAPTKILHQMGYDVLLVDFRGAGGSSGSDTTLGIREAEDVARAVEFAKRKWSTRPVILYGASMGAVAVMRSLAHQNVTPDAIILESPFDRLLTTVRHRFTAMGLPTFPGAELIVFWGGVQQRIDGFAHNPVEYAKSIICPALLMHGDADKRVTVQEASAIFTNLKGSKTLAVFPGANGHGALAIESPAQWQFQVQEFLTKIER